MTLFRTLLLWLVLALAGALAAQLLLAQDPGYVLVRWRGYDYTTTVLIAIGVLIAAAFAVRGRALRVVSIAVGAVAVAAAVPAVQLLVGGGDADTAARIAELPGRATVTAVTVSPLPAVLALLGACLALAAAVALWRTPREQAGLSAKYDSPAARRDAAVRRAETDEPMTERTLWDAMDAGEDPTVDRGDDGNDDGDISDSGTRR